MKHTIFMKNNSYAFFVILLFFNLSIGQKKTNQEIGFTSDNDLYVSLFLDGYYTNGLDIFYKKAIFKNDTKYIHQVNIGQKIYNAYQHDVPLLKNHDRPYGGYAYVSYYQLKTNKNHLLGYGITLGYTGEHTKAQDAQNLIHVLYGIEKTEGWNYQIKQQFEPRFTFYYNKNLYHNKDGYLQASFTNQLNLGTILSNASSGIAFKIKSGESYNAPLNNSSFYGTALQTENENWLKENYLGIKSYFTYQFLDKTVTGEIENNIINKQFNINPLVWHNDIGYYWNLEHWNISYHQIFHTQNVKKMTKYWVRYGTIQVSYKF